MKKIFALVLGIAAFASLCRAEPRWCSITNFREGENLIYPPIARQAYVYGVVLGRVTYSPNGTVQSFDFVSGPRLLAAGLEKQMKGWAITTSAQGDEVCETLVIADFRLDDSSGQSKSYEIDVSTPSILRLRASATPVCLCDPSGEIGPKPFLRRFGSVIRRVFNKFTTLGN